MSTGRLPGPEEARRLVEAAHSEVWRVADGVVSDVYLALARVSPDLFGVCVVGVTGAGVGVGDVDQRFALMSVAKPFVLALVVERAGFHEVRELVGVNATGPALNSIGAVDTSPDGRTNPMVNSGAIATISMIPGDSAEQSWRFVRGRAVGSPATS